MSISAPGSPLPPLAPPIRKALASALELQQKGRLDQAIASFRQLRVRYPKLAILQKYLGLALIDAGLRQAGIAELSTAAAALPWDGEAQWQLGMALLSGGEASRGLEAIERAVHRAGLSATLLAQAGARLLRGGRIEAAVEAFRRRVRQEPREATAWADLTLALYEADAVDEAMRASREAAARDARYASELCVGSADPVTGRELKRVTLTPAEALSPAFAGAEALARFTAERDLHILDEVLPDPAGYREAALRRHFHSELYSGQNYPGQQTTGSDAGPLMALMATALGRRIKWISPDNGAFRLSLADTRARTDIHVDSELEGQPDDYAAVLYLSPPEHARGGTVFWRHRATGFDRRPTPEALAAAGYRDFADFQRRHLPRDTLQAFSSLVDRRTDWEATVQLPFRFNRLVIYQGQWYHSIGELFGSTPQDGRLVQLFRFRA